MDGSMNDLRKKVKELEDELLEDCIALGNLKWKVADLEKKGKSGRKGKRTYRKQGTRPGHHYQTRYAATFKNDDDAVELRKKEQEDMKRRMKALEEKVERKETELEEFLEDLGNVEALTQEISELSEGFDKFRTNQVKINLASFGDVSGIRNRVSAIEPRLQNHDKEILALNLRYNALFAIASNLLGQQIAAGRPVNLTNLPIIPLPNPNYVSNFSPAVRSSAIHSPISLPMGPTPNQPKPVAA